jgi:hypothetical protein
LKQKKHNLGNTKNTCNNEEIESGDDTLEKALCESADPLPYCGGESWQRASMDKKSSSSQKKSAQKNRMLRKGMRGTIQTVTTCGK